MNNIDNITTDFHPVPTTPAPALTDAELAKLLETKPDGIFVTDVDETDDPAAPTLH